MSKPAIIFVPGAWIPKTSYASFLHALEKEEFTVHYASYPSFDPVDSLNASCERDAEVIRNDVIKPLVEDQGQEVVVLMHSYASMPGSAAASGLSKTERIRNGQSGGVIGLICIGAFLVPQGLSCAGLQGGKLPDWILHDQVGILIGTSAYCQEQTITLMIMVY
jgi:hypothetical protein